MPICHNCNGSGKHLGLGGVYEKCRPCNETGRVAQDNSGLAPSIANPTIVEGAPIIPAPISYEAPTLLQPSTCAHEIQELKSSITEIHSRVDKILRLLLTKEADAMNDQEAHEKAKPKKAKSKSV